MLEGPHDLVIRGGAVVSGRGSAPADVAIREGRIEVVARDLAEAPAARVIDASGKLVLPGAIDVHTHPVYEDDFEGTSRAALHGGVTTILAFAGANPAWGLGGVGLTEAIRWFVREGEAKSLLDFGLHATVLPTDAVAPEVDALVEMGVTSFKFFMSYRKRGMMLADDQILRVMEALAAAGALAIVHAENGLAIEHLTEKLAGAPPVGNDAFLRAHRDLLEAEAIFRAVALAEAAHCPLYVPHVAVKEGLQVVAPFKRDLGIPIFLETCPHYLLLTNQEVLRRGALAKIAPPLRERHDADALWEALRDGLVDVVGSDHCGYSAERKLKSTHILDAPFGAPGVEQMLPLLYSEGVRKGRISLGRLVQVLCENPARIFGLYPRKGAILPGADADLVVFDPEARRTHTAANQHGNADYCLYEGMETVGAPTLVVQRGRVLLEEGRLLATPGSGRFLLRTSSCR